MDASQSSSNTESPNELRELSAYAETNSLFPPPPVPQNVFDPPVSGIRIPLSGDRLLPPLSQLGPPAASGANGSVWLGSALFDDFVHPCAITPHLDPPCRVPWGGAEYGHRERFDVLVIDERMMEWVPARSGQAPRGRRVVEGGYERAGPLHHARAMVSGQWAVGKAGVHLRGANVLFGGREVEIHRGKYEVLCWREEDA